MKKMKKIVSIITSTLLIALLGLILNMQFLPENIKEKIGYHTYVVITNSMEPTIPTYSLVISKYFNNNKTIKPNSIITFKANRGDNEVLVTHYYRKKQFSDDGNIYYRTQPEGVKNQYDLYETKRSDIVGTYVFHIPYVGKFILFLQSKFGLLLYAELFVIWCVNKLIQAKWEEKENDEEEKSKIEIVNYSFEEIEKLYSLHIYKIEGIFRSRYLLPKKNINLEIICYDEEDQVCYQEEHKVLKKRMYYRRKKYFIAKVHLRTTIKRIELKAVNAIE